jgi:hypothetical protein
MGKRIKLGVAKLGERGQSGGAFITGANLRRRPKESDKPPEPPEEDEGEAPDEGAAA